MNKRVFPMIAAGIGLLLALVLARSMTVDEAGETGLPHLTLLFISEFGFLITVAGAWVGGRVWLATRGPLNMLLAAAGCAVLALAFLYLGIELWGAVAPA